MTILNARLTVNQLLDILEASRQVLALRERIQLTLVAEDFPLAAVSEARFAQLARALSVLERPDRTDRVIERPESRTP